VSARRSRKGRARGEIIAAFRKAVKSPDAATECLERLFGPTDSDDETAFVDRMVLVGLVAEAFGNLRTAATEARKTNEVLKVALGVREL
jgi:hypothetical protein